MRCPFCQNPDTQVIDSRAPEEGYAIRRRRKCPACGKRFTTFERAHLPIPAVVKRNGQRTDYNRAKLQASMTLALRKRPVTPEQLEEAAKGMRQGLGQGGGFPGMPRGMTLPSGLSGLMKKK